MTTQNNESMNFNKQLDRSRFGTMLERSKMDVKPHQQQGVEWCINRELSPPAYGPVRGGIMADEMGLGKTVQMLGVMLSHFQRRTLILLPKSLIEQWVGAMERMLGHTPLVFHGPIVSRLTHEELANAPVVISTYGMLRDESPLIKIKWNRIICDEAHHLRNQKTKKYEIALKLNSDIMWFMTGTPIQNRSSDLYSLFNIMKISKNNYQFGEKKMKPNYEAITEIKKNIILMRTKSSVNIKLPKTTTHNITVSWKNDKERDIAEEIHAHLKLSNIEMDRANRFMSPFDRKILPFLCFTKQVCTAPKSLTKHIKKLTGQESLIGESLRDELPEDIQIMQTLEKNSKLDCALKLLLSRKNNNRFKLVFAQYKTEMAILERMLAREGIQVDVVNGGTPARERRSILENVPSHTETQDYVLVLQIQVGCEGLNLQQFSEVYFLSPNWNPAVEDQAVARCHRIGQTEPVDIFRFSMENFGRETVNIEDYIKETQTTKRKKMIKINQCANGKSNQQRELIVSH